MKRMPPVFFLSIHKNVTLRKCSSQCAGLQISAHSFTYPKFLMIAIWIVGFYCSHCRYTRLVHTRGTFEVVNHTIHSFIWSLFLFLLGFYFCVGNGWMIADGIALSRKISNDGFLNCPYFLFGVCVWEHVCMWIYIFVLKFVLTPVNMRLWIYTYFMRIICRFQDYSHSYHQFLTQPSEQMNVR